MAGRLVSHQRRRIRKKSICDLFTDFIYAVVVLFTVNLSNLKDAQ